MLRAWRKADSEDTTGTGPPARRPSGAHATRSLARADFASVLWPVDLDIVAGAEDGQTLGVAGRVEPNVESLTLKTFVRDTAGPGATVFTNTAVQMAAMARGSLGNRLCYADLTA